MTCLIDINREYLFICIRALFMNKIRFITICLSFFAMALGIKAFAQEVHGYGMGIANDLSDHNFIVTSHGYVNDSSYLYEVRMETLDYYDEELARMAITTELGKYSDIKRIEPWSRSGSLTESTYRIYDTELSIIIYENSKDSYGLPRGCSIYIYEFINPDWKKAKYTTKKKRTSKKRRGKRK